MNLIEQKIRFDSPQFQQEYHTDIPLGAFPAPGGTLFRLWAPTATQVEITLYDRGAGGQPLSTHPLVRGAQGVWSFRSPDDLNGFYYEYGVTADGEKRVTADPYARSSGLNGKRSMVLDLKSTDPEGWRDDAPPPPAPEQIIYELHVKDFSHAPAGGFPEEERGKYAALCRVGTTLNGDGVHPTGLDYLKNLGITHVQLMPVYDYGSVDEGGSPEEYNWGYDPVNYNVPEGSYSSNPHRGEVRVRELKKAVQALHTAGLRVIMDVVYNHTYHLDSCLWRTVPWYFYRQTSDGSASNGSGCGSELASERSMCARYILDSVMYWAEEYHMDGFRFDLMGMMDVDLLNNIQASLDARFGKGEKLIYGEPWCGGTCHPQCGTRLCTKEHLRSLNPAIGAFCDQTRDAVKGSLMGEEARGFVNGGGITADALRPCLTGWAGEHAPHQAPSQTISYLSCHDDWTLWDKLIFTLDPQRRFDQTPKRVLRANKLAAAINFSCQGRLFLLAGEEFGRTKGGVKNSYNAPPQVNQLNWERAWQNQDLADYYRGLIALRKRLPALQLKGEGADSRLIFCVDVRPGCVCACVDNSGFRSPWDQLLLFFSPGEESYDVNLPVGTWQVLVTGQSSTRWQEKRMVSGGTTVPAGSALILGRMAETM